MELQWQRHQEQEQLLAAVPASLAGGGIIEVSSLAHLEALLGAAGGQLVVLTAYTRSCGICKHVLRELEVVLCEARQQRARIVFMRHDLQDAWDFPTDVARWYKLKTAPRFLFFVDVSTPSEWQGGLGGLPAEPVAAWGRVIAFVKVMRCGLGAHRAPCVNSACCRGRCCAQPALPTAARPQAAAAK